MMEVRKGDADAFEILLKRHEARVYRLAYSILTDREDARDIAQEIFLHIWDKPHSWRGKALFTTWLYRVTVNRALTRRRNLKIRSFFSISDMSPQQLPEMDEGSSPDASLVKDEELHRLEQELKRLPQRQRTALHLKYREGLSVAEVAEALGGSVKSAESLIFRAKQTIRSRIKGENE